MIGIDDTHTHETDGFTIHYRIEPDEFPDLSYLGEWSDTPHPDRRLAVDVWATEHGYVHARDQHSRYEPRCYRWFNPAYGGDAERFPTPVALDLMMKEIARSYCKGDRNAAYLGIMGERSGDYKRACTFGVDWWTLVVCVEVSRAGVVLGTAALGGVDSDGYDSAKACAEEHGLADEALDDARAKRAELCA